jgi:TolA-binding protein
MTQKLIAVVIGLLVVGAAAPASAANKEHQQLMADIRMLQEQTQLLQNLLGQFNEALKAVNTRLDQQTEANRKLAADQKLAIDNLTNDARVIREKLDDNNVRVGSLTQEVDALRQSMQQMATRPAATDPFGGGDPSAAAGGGAMPPPAGVPPSPSAPAPATPTMTASPRQVWDAAYADYTSGQYDLAVLGFEAYIRNFPKSDSADDAQVLICAAFLADKKYQKAVDACDAAIRTYPAGNAIPDAYFRKGLALADMRDVNGARTAWETVVRNFPDSDAGRLAKQRLDQIRRND